jgi:streptogramin lyase
MRRTSVGRSARGITAYRAVLIVALSVGLVAPMTGTAHAIGYSLTVATTGSGEGTVETIPQFQTFADPGIHDVYSITTGPDGEQWFLSADPDELTVGRITTEGVVTTHPARPRVGREFHPDPATIIAGPDGNLWVSDYASDTITRVTPGGEFTSFDSMTAGPAGITVGSDGNLWFTGVTGDIGRITPSGAVTIFSPVGIAVPTDITTGPDGNLWFTDAGEEPLIGRMTTAGVLTTYTHAELEMPHSIVAGPDGALHFANSYSLGRITTDGDISFQRDYQVIGYLGGLVAGSDQALWFPNDSGTIGRVDMLGNGDAYWDHDPNTTMAFGMSQGPTALWAAGGTDDRISRITPDAGIDCGEDCSAIYSGGNVTLRADAEYPNRFMGWTGDCAGETSPECTVTMSQSRTVSAEFAHAPTPKWCEAPGENYNVIVGTSDNDVLTGTDGPDAICGGRGSDLLRGLGGNDVVYGGNGNDTIRGGGGVDWTRGGAGMDTLDDGAGDDFSQGGPDDDTLHGGEDADQLRGNGGNDALFGNAGEDYLLGGYGRDALNGGMHRDICFGGPGHDSLVSCEPRPEE